MNGLLIQLIGLIGFTLFGIGFLFKKRTKILTIQSIGVLIWSLHYYLLAAWTGGTLTTINSFKIYLFSFKSKRKQLDKKIILYLFIAIFIVIGTLTWQGYQSLLAIAAMSLNTIAQWQKNPFHIRLLSLPPSIIWLTYNFIVGSYAGIIANIIIFLFITIGLIKIDLLKK